MKINKGQFMVFIFSSMEGGLFKLNNIHCMLSVVAVFPHQGILTLEFLFEALGNKIKDGSKKKIVH